MSPFNKHLAEFVIAAESLLEFDHVLLPLTPKDQQTIQYYLAALAAKYPALLK